MADARITRIKVPNFQVDLSFTQDFHKENLKNLAREVLVDEKLVEALEADPATVLERYGVIITVLEPESGEFPKISRQQLWKYLHRPGEVSKKEEEEEEEEDQYGCFPYVMLIFVICDIYC
ncbi:MAG: hypothetical protein KAV87_64570 [Desulfobacteraceae bacterium]|nr:hypothetical protein [Desulfobacteraceae bacterium]